MCPSQAGQAAATPARSRGAVPSAGPRHRKTIQSVSRALDLLEALALQEEVGLVDLAGATGLLPSTAHRLLATLAERKYVAQNPETGCYVLGYKVLELASYARLGVSYLRALARPHLEELCRTVGETTKLVILDGTSVVYLDTVDATRSVRGFARIGQTLPAHVAASGKAILSFQGNEIVDSIVVSAAFGQKLTPHTIADEGGFRRALARVRRQGYAVDLEEHEEGVVCVAAPIVDREGLAVAAISMSGPADRMRKASPRRIGELMRAHTLQISAELGYGSPTEPRGRGRAR
jgi:IclR family acetate operon transcriptional repressor